MVTVGFLSQINREHDALIIIIYPAPGITARGHNARRLRMREVIEEDAWEHDWLVEVERQYEHGSGRGPWIRTQKGFDTREEAKDYFEKVKLKESDNYTYWEVARYGKLFSNEEGGREVESWYNRKESGQ